VAIRGDTILVVAKMRMLRGSGRTLVGYPLKGFMQPWRWVAVGREGVFQVGWGLGGRVLIIDWTQMVGEAVLGGRLGSI
jgi:hypothetical protein